MREVGTRGRRAAGTSVAGDGHGAVPIEPVVALSTSADAGGLAAAGGVTMVTRTGIGPNTRAMSFLPTGSWRALAEDAELRPSAVDAGLPVPKRGSAASAKGCVSALMGQACVASIRNLGAGT
jgi:hypothetical protein